MTSLHERDASRFDAHRVLEVALCVVSFDRSEGLARLLDGIAALQVADYVPLRLRVIVVDNHHAGTAAATVEAARACLPWPIDYVVEPRRGIPHARNRAVALARGADFVAFLDDDEVPEPTWLAELLHVQRATCADVVLGPSVPVFPEGAPAWVIDGGFFDRRRWQTGERIPFNYARTSGVLVAADALPPGPQPFDERYRYSGGSDVALFARLDAEGRTIAWADRAVVIERVPRSRAGVRWLLRRAYRIGNNRSMRLAFAGAGRWRRLMRIGGGTTLVVRGLALAVVSIGRGRAAQVRALQVAAKGAGLVTGMLGLQYQEFRVVDGR